MKVLISTEFFSNFYFSIAFLVLLRQNRFSDKAKESSLSNFRMHSIVIVPEKWQVIGDQNPAVVYVGFCME